MRGHASGVDGLPAAQDAAGQASGPGWGWTAGRDLFSASPRRRWLLPALLLLVLLALPPRLLGLGEAVTEDEDQWIGRTGNFARALEHGAWRDTFQIGHPGVTTMWLTALALGPDATRFSAAERPERVVTRTPGFLPALHQARLPFLALNALLVGVCGLLAWRLLGPGPGLLAGLLMALEPYWLAMSPIVGMDGLLAGLLSVSLLAAIAAFEAVGRARWALALLSGLAAGLALLTKGTALFLLPALPLLAFESVWQARRRGPALRAAVATLAVWAIGLALAAPLWPALWADPVGTLRRTAEFVQETGGTPHGPGNFFLGQPVEDPGPLFYPVALALRLGPATLLGLLALPLTAVLGWRSGAGRPAGGTAWFLAVFAALFVLGLSYSPKKVDRYLLPVLPALAVLAGLGWWRVLERLAGARPGTAARTVAAGAAALGLLQLWALAGAPRHPLTAFNPLAGGMPAAVGALPVGWGEGLDLVGAELARQPGADQLVIAIWYPLYVNFQAHVPGQVVNITFSDPGRVSSRARYAGADYYVDYLHARQRRLTPRELAGQPPEFVVTINGAEYARVYRLK